MSLMGKSLLQKIPFSGLDKLLWQWIHKSLPLCNRKIDLAVATEQSDRVYKDANRNQFQSDALFLPLGSPEVM